MFAHLHVRSYFSFLEGLASPADLAAAAVRCGGQGLALTDSHSLTGAVEFVKVCQEAGIQPVIGLSLRVQPPAFLNGQSTAAFSRQGEANFPAGVVTPTVGAPVGALGALAGAVSSGELVLLLEEDRGWPELCALASEAVPPGGLRFEVLAAHTTGLVCLTGGRSGTLARLSAVGHKELAARYLSQLHDLFPGRLYVELQQHTPEDAHTNYSLAALAHRWRLPVVATHSIYYLQPSQAHLQRLVSAIRLNQPLTGLPEEAVAPPEAYFLSPEAMQGRFQSIPGALETSQEILSRCQGLPPLHVAHFPAPHLPGDQDAGDALREWAVTGAWRLYRQITPEIQTRLDYELDIINRRGYAPIFLIMQEVIEFAHRQGIPTASRGSASSSLVAHCLGITTPDPLRHNLYFERFLNPARKSPPDIDTDICSVRRKEVLHFVTRRFGEDQTAMVATISRFRQRSALREVAKAYGLPPAQVSAMASALPYRWFGPRSQEAENDPYASLRDQFNSPVQTDILLAAAALIGTPDHLSMHPGGMVIAPGPLHDLAATQPGGRGVRITQFDLESISELGLVKLDLLGIRGLTVLGQVASELAKTDTAQRLPLDLLEGIPEDDPATSETIRQGRTFGCFQIESPGMRATLREIQARTVDDILAALALYRPGPLTGGLKDAFVRRHLGLETPEQLHPSLTPLLAETYGVILYQEQVLRIAHELGGLTLADSDLLRRAMSHFDPGKEMQNLREKFIQGAWERNQVPQATAMRIWDLMAAFAGYGFPKAHAASYAVVSWRAAWCKTHYPALFMTAVLAGGGGYYRQQIYLNEARRSGLKLKAPLVNQARSNFHLVYQDGLPVLLMGLDQVKELTRRTQERIIARRPFASLADFLARVDPRPQEAENLARCGALEGLGGSIPALLEEIKEGWRVGQLPLFPNWRDELEEWSLPARVEAQQAILGAGLDAHPLELAADRLGNTLTTLEAAGRTGQRVRVAGVRQTWRRSRGQSGKQAYWMALEDLEGYMDVFISAEVYQRSRAALDTPGPYIIEGQVVFPEEATEPVLVAGQIESVWMAKQ